MPEQEPNNQNKKEEHAEEAIETGEDDFKGFNEAQVRIGGLERLKGQGEKIGDILAEINGYLDTINRALSRSYDIDSANLDYEGLDAILAAVNTLEQLREVENQTGVKLVYMDGKRANSLIDAIENHPQFKALADANLKLNWENKEIQGMLAKKKEEMQGRIEEMTDIQHPFVVGIIRQRLERLSQVRSDLFQRLLPALTYLIIGLSVYSVLKSDDMVGKDWEQGWQKLGGIARVSDKEEEGSDGLAM